MPVRFQIVEVSQSSTRCRPWGLRPSNPRGSGGSAPWKSIHVSWTKCNVKDSKEAEEKRGEAEDDYRHIVVATPIDRHQQIAINEYTLKEMYVSTHFNDSTRLWLLLIADC